MYAFSEIEFFFSLLKVEYEMVFVIPELTGFVLQFLNVLGHHILNAVKILGYNLPNNNNEGIYS